MNPTDTLPPLPPDPAASSGASSGPAADEQWPAAGPSKGMRIRLPIAIAALVVVAFGGVAAGATLKKTPAITTQAGSVRGNRAFGGNGTAGANGGTGAAGANGAGRFGAGGGVFGTVTKVEGNTLTVTQRDGTTATVVVPSGTNISKTVSGSLSDVTAGTSIVVRGTTAGGKTTAEQISINPANGAGGFGGFGGGRGGAGGAATTPTTTT